MNTTALGPMTVISMEGEAKSSTEKVFRGAWRAAIALLVAILLFLAWLVRNGHLYEAGSDFGYYLGLVGGLLMLSLLLYPIRKRLGAYDRFGKMETWFRFHMIAGITGPLLVLFHSTFRTGSMNGAVALYAMLLVALSGVVGRFLYRRVHRGLYGKRLTLEEASANLKACAENMGSVFALRPDIEPRLQDFQAEALEAEGSWWERTWKFLTLRWRCRELSRELRRDAKSALRKLGRKKRVQHQQLILNYQLARRQIDKYLDAVLKASQLSVWERLFSYWHIIHIPFLYLLVFSGVVHVVAVHMY
jgi:hypothetical protein